MNMLKKIWVLIAITSLLIGCNNPGNNKETSESTYDRVIKSNKLTCGYVTYPPGCIKDPNTGKLTGIFVETLEKAAENLGMKVEWKEEVGWGTMIEGLKANRYDLIGSPVWANSSRAKLAGFTIPLFYSGIGIYVRSNDDRFQNTPEGLSKINNKNIRISTLDGEMSDIITNADFPQATKVSLPQNSDNSQLLLNVVNNKADITFVEPSIAEDFLKNNPGSIKNIASDKPIRVFPNTMMTRIGDVNFQSMLNIALAELINSGYVDKLIDKYDPTGKSFYRVAYPYQPIK